MPDTIDNVCDMTCHTMKMAFFVENHGKQQISQSERRRGAALSSYTRLWLIRILGKIRHCSRFKPEIKYTLFQRERATFIPSKHTKHVSPAVKAVSTDFGILVNLYQFQYFISCLEFQFFYINEKYI